MFDDINLTGIEVKGIYEDKEVSIKLKKIEDADNFVCDSAKEIFIGFGTPKELEILYDTIPFRVATSIGQHNLDDYDLKESRRKMWTFWVHTEWKNEDGTLWPGSNAEDGDGDNYPALAVKKAIALIREVLDLRWAPYEK